MVCPEDGITGRLIKTMLLSEESRAHKCEPEIKGLRGRGKGRGMEEGKWTREREGEKRGRKEREKGEGGEEREMERKTTRWCLGRAVRPPQGLPLRWKLDLVPLLLKAFQNLLQDTT